MQRLEVRAKFFYEGDRKVFLHGATYGPFRPAGPGEPYLPARDRVERDFGLMRDLGINTLRLYHTPPEWFLDRCADRGLRCLVTIPWHKRVLFLDDSEAMAATRRNIREAARANAGHPALMGYFIDNELPPDLVRWYGPKRIEQWLNSLVAIVKRHDPTALAAYANFPPTEYILPAAVDFLSYNVYLHHQPELARYLARLQNLAGEKPLVLSEFGMDTIRHPEEEQAALLSRHVETVFKAGLAGTIIFSWTDEWFTDGVDVTDWAFGIVRADRHPKIAYQALKPFLAEPSRLLYQRFPLARFPKVSVVVCSYNGARTLHDCLASLEKISYPDYEVIFVDDGSRDHSQEIVKGFPGVRNIRQDNMGLSVARNVGIHASTGEIVAFTDSDCMADPDWLYFLVHALQSGDFAAVGGPNISPPATNWVQATVGVAPGSPSHVLLTDNEAEHVPGCNMAYYKWALDEIGGFDPEYRKAGDDVDVCWRIMQLGYRIGFSPSAIVWHYRRFTVATYFSQQRGYGEAEALLRYKHMQYFGPTGSAIWRGQVYTHTRLDPIFSAPIVYHGIFGTGLFQSIYHRPASGWSALLGSLEWLGLSLFIFLLSVPLEELRMLPLIMFGLTLLVGLTYTIQARIEPKFDSLFARLLLLWLCLNQPWRRSWARYFTWLRGKRTPKSVLDRHRPRAGGRIGWFNTGLLTFWSEKGHDRTHLLGRLQESLRYEGWKFTADTGWTDWDIQIFASRWWNVRLRTMTEIYPHGRRLTRVGNYLQVSNFSTMVGGIAFTFITLLLLSVPQALGPAAAVLGIGIGGLFLDGLRLRRRVADLIEKSAQRAGLDYVTKRQQRQVVAEPVEK
jgi:glycosyltransferase involved in cell wall biosynthesis